MQKVHFIGIGGCGMNGVAQLAAHAGYSVSGSDRATGLDIFQCLEKQSISVVPQDGSGITDQTDFVVYSTAIEADNPDILKAKELNIPLLHRAEMLAKLCEGKEVIAIAGTAGKSTVTGLLGHIFQCLEKDPTVYCGAPVLNWQHSVNCRAGTVENLPAAAGRTSSIPALQIESPGNIRFGTGPWIIEADESDKSFLHFHPAHAIITNIAEDHYSLEELHKLFEQFEAQVSGIVIKTPEKFDTPSPLLGKHNIENINNALTLCKTLGLDMHKCMEAVASFKGIERRLERHGPNVIDDFAHSPIKIDAALDAVSEVWPVFSVVWRPHGFTPLFQMQDALCETFSGHRVFILPVYYAGGTVDRKITSEHFVKKLKAAGVPAEFVPDFQCLEKTLLASGLPVLIMGARDPELPRFARRMAGLLRESS
jgi:UDP-N-acetylmuramate--alanine ligase